MKNLPVVLVTGGAGFIGCNLVQRLVQQRRARVVNVDALTYAGNAESLAGLEGVPGYNFLHADIRDQGAMERVFASHRPTGVIHLAAESHVDRSIDGPRVFVETNVMGTYSLLEAARGYFDRLDEAQRQAFRFVAVSTDEVYGSLGESGLFSEASPYQPSSPYAATKAGADHLVRAYHHTYGLPALVTNCSNNYGPYQFPEKLIPLMITRALAGEALPVYGKGLNVRDWLYVGDHCEALWTVLQRGEPGQTYNIGGNHERRNIEVVEQICEALQQLLPPRDNPAADVEHYRDLITFVVDRPGHDLRYAIDASRIQQQLDWTPAESFDSGLRKTIRWYLDHRAWVARVVSGDYRQWIDKNYGDRGG